MNKKQSQSEKLFLILGYVCGSLALFIFPIGLGFAGLVFGSTNLVKGRTGHGVAQIIIAGICATVGQILKISHHRW